MTYTIDSGCNTLRLLRGKAFYTDKEYKKFQKGDTIFGIDSNPAELGRWDISQKENAFEELMKHKCLYLTGGNNNMAEEYALEIFKSDEDGDWISGSDFFLSDQFEEGDSFEVYDEEKKNQDT